MGEHVNGSSESASPQPSWSLRTVVDDDAYHQSSDGLTAERRSGWFDGCAEGLFRIDFAPPVLTDEPDHVVASHLRERGILRECNAAMLPYLKAKAFSDVIGTSVRSHPFLMTVGSHFVRNGRHLEGHAVLGPGKENVFVSALGTYEDGRLARVWGRCRNESVGDKVALLDALERQKQQIGLELHDGIGQLLTAVRITSQDIVDTLSEQPDNPVRQLSQRLCDEAEEALGLLRDITTTLSPAAILRGDTLKSALELLTTKTCRVASVDCRLEWHGTIRIPQPEIRLHAYRIVQEAVTNALKHSQAKTIVVRGRKGSSGLALTITDDGIGFDSRSARRESIGIESLRHRAAVIGAELTIRSATGGTEVSFFIPNPVLQSDEPTLQNGRST